MNSSDPHLLALDRALVALLQERARAAAESGGAAAIDDLLARTRGPLSADVIRGVCELLESGSAS